jgi:hypothetical protein
MLNADQRAGEKLYVYAELMGPESGRQTWLHAW